MIVVLHVVGAARIMSAAHRLNIRGMTVRMRRARCSTELDQIVGWSQSAGRFSTYCGLKPQHPRRPACATVPAAPTFTERAKCGKIALVDVPRGRLLSSESRPKGFCAGHPRAILKPATFNLASHKEAW